MPSSRLASTMALPASAPFSFPLILLSSRFFAQRPFPSMIMATCLGRAEKSCCVSFEGAGLEFKDLFLFFFKCVIDEFDMVIGNLLDFRLGLERLIFRDLSVLFQAFDEFVGFPPDVPKSHLVLFAQFIDDLYQLFAPLFG